MAKGRIAEQARQEKVRAWREQRIAEARGERAAEIGRIRECYEDMNRRIREANGFSKASEYELLRRIALLADPQLSQSHKFMDTNEGECVICLSARAVLMMDKCRHLVACANCHFMLKLHAKCPLCRAPAKPVLVAKTS